MESSFTKGYDKTVNADGSIDLNFKSEKIGAHSGSGFASILVFAMFPVSCAVTSPVLFPFYDSRAKDSLSLGALLFWVACAVGLWVWSVRKFNISKTTLLIKPKEGLIFGGKQLPFSEIQSIGTMNETTGRNAKGTAYVYANSHGQHIKVTRYVPLALADAISEEIKSSSGIEWK